MSCGLVLAAIGSGQAQTIRPSDTGQGYVVYGGDGTYEGRLTPRGSGGYDIRDTDGTWLGKIVPNDLDGYDVRSSGGTTLGTTRDTEGDNTEGD
jgi:hypothetical protein